MQNSSQHEFSGYGKTLTKVGYAAASIAGLAMTGVSMVHHRSGWDVAYGVIIAVGSGALFLGRVLHSRRHDHRNSPKLG
jgi:hypothetical protein